MCAIVMSDGHAEYEDQAFLTVTQIQLGAVFRVRRWLIFIERCRASR